MPLLDTAARAVTNRLPKVISPRTHAVIDYLVAGAFIAGGVALWGRHKRAALCALIVGAAETATSLITDYPGGVTKSISFPLHGKIDAGMSGLVGSMPSLFGFEDDGEATFFRGQAVAMAAVTGLTDFEAPVGRKKFLRAA